MTRIPTSSSFCWLRRHQSSDPPRNPTVLGSRTKVAKARPESVKTHRSQGTPRPPAIPPRGPAKRKPQEAQAPSSVCFFGILLRIAKACVVKRSSGGSRGGANQDPARRDGAQDEEEPNTGRKLRGNKSSLQSALRLSRPLPALYRSHTERENMKNI